MKLIIVIVGAVLIAFIPWRHIYWLRVTVSVAALLFLLMETTAGLWAQYRRVIDTMDQSGKLTDEVYKALELLKEFQVPIADNIALAGIALFLLAVLPWPRWKQVAAEAQPAPSHSPLETSNVDRRGT
jgi:hypothetical protein